MKKAAQWKRFHNEKVRFLNENYCVNLCITFKSHEIGTRNCADELPTCALCMDEIENILNYKSVKFRNLRRQ